VRLLPECGQTGRFVLDQGPVSLYQRTAKRISVPRPPNRSRQSRRLPSTATASTMTRNGLMRREVAGHDSARAQSSFAARRDISNGSTATVFCTRPGRPSRWVRISGIAGAPPTANWAITVGQRPSFADVSEGPVILDRDAD